ncbi:hypothetical protein QL285_011009 [Trifolium repens]|nr:hypothetical protein QL285_085612 [Trifolium repens]KAK2381411.1 hypothetical protein QL285_069011 [Trifolium repens]KAK2438030.1 hypothetical protein QL285_022851 [Trifolium repens]KAK2452005.1 hypothetical protein QL285_011009 [Trifolium repens]
MASSSTTPKEQPKIETFSIVRLSHQGHAEIETAFARRHRSYLSKTWKVIKNDKHHHKLKWNKNYENPLLLNEGWESFKKFHNLPDDVEVVLQYFGHDLFGVKSFKKLAGGASIPPFHSRSFVPKKTDFFQFKLTNMRVDNPKLVLDSDFAQFLRSYNLEYINLCGDNGMTMTLCVLNLGDMLRTKLAYNWGEFSKSQQFKEGDLVTFKFELIDEFTASPRCHVYK